MSDSIQKRLRATRPPKPSLQQRTDGPRPSPTRRGYDRQWEKLRARFLRDNPECEACGKPAAHVDHVIPIKAGGARMDAANLQALCHGCHSRKTVREDGGFGNTQK